MWAGSTLLLFTDMLCKFNNGSRNGWMNEHEAVVTTISHMFVLLIWSTDLLCLLCGSGPAFLLYLSFLTYVAGEQRVQSSCHRDYRGAELGPETHSVSSCWDLFLTAPSCSCQNPTGPQWFAPPLLDDKSWLPAPYTSPTPHPPGLTEFQKSTSGHVVPWLPCPWLLAAKMNSTFLNPTHKGWCLAVASSHCLVSLLVSEQLFHTRVSRRKPSLSPIHPPDAHVDLTSGASRVSSEVPAHISGVCPKDTPYTSFVFLWWFHTYWPSAKREQGGGIKNRNISGHGHSYTVSGIECSSL